MILPRGQCLAEVQRFRRESSTKYECFVKLKGQISSDRQKLRNYFTY